MEDAVSGIFGMISAYCEVFLWFMRMAFSDGALAAYRKRYMWFEAFVPTCPLSFG